MNPFEAEQFPQLLAMRQRARRRELMTSAAVAAGLLMILLLLVSSVFALQALIEWIRGWVSPQLPALRPGAESAVALARDLLG